MEAIFGILFIAVVIGFNAWVTLWTAKKIDENYKRAIAAGDSTAAEDRDATLMIFINTTNTPII